MKIPISFIPHFSNRRRPSWMKSCWPSSESYAPARRTCSSRPQQIPVGNKVSTVYIHSTYIYIHTYIQYIHDRLTTCFHTSLINEYTYISARIQAFIHTAWSPNLIGGGGDELDRLQSKIFHLPNFHLFFFQVSAFLR